MAQTLPSPSDIQYQLSHVDDNRQPELIAAYTICGTLAVVSVGSRFLSRRLNTSGIEADDYAALVGMICALGYIVGQAVAIKHGLGRHRILSTAPIQSGKAVLVSIIMYLASMAATKISILLLYRRIFPIWKLRCIGWAVGIFIFAYSFAAVFAVIFACHPVEGVWNPLVSAKCNNTNATVLVMAIFNVVTDVIVLVLPMPVIWELQLPKTRKFQVMAVFLLGSFTTIVSVYRTTQIQITSWSDLTWTSVDRALWTGVECLMAVVCGSLPVIRPLVKKVIHWVVGSASRSSSTNTSSVTNRKLWNTRVSSFSLSKPAKRHNMNSLRLEVGPGGKSRVEKPRPLHLRYQLSPLRMWNRVSSEPEIQFDNLETRAEGL